MANDDGESKRSLEVTLNYNDERIDLDKIRRRFFERPSACLGMWNGEMSKEDESPSRYGEQANSLVILLTKSNNEDNTPLSLNLDGD